MTRQVDILLIEDNPGDARLTEEALRQSGAGCRLTLMRDPEDALTFLKGEGPYQDRMRPGIIFLDMSLPKYTGLEVIAAIRKTEGLAHTPIVVLSGSVNPDEIRQAYKLGGNCFIRKPLDLGEFIRHMTTCYEFWCDVVVLPPSENGIGA